MKTFKLKMLKLTSNNETEEEHIPLLDGLIINREDDKNYWLIEAYIEKNYKDFFTQLAEKEKSLMLEVKISKEDNVPAFFTSKIISVNPIGDNINVLFIGTIVNSRKL